MLQASSSGVPWTEVEAGMPWVLPGVLFHSLLAQKYLIAPPSAAQWYEPQDRRWWHLEDSLQKHISDPNKNCKQNLQTLLLAFCTQLTPVYVRKEMQDNLQSHNRYISIPEIKKK